MTPSTKPSTGLFILQICLIALEGVYNNKAQSRYFFLNDPSPFAQRRDARGISIRSQIINLITLPLFRQQEAAREGKRNLGYVPGTSALRKHYLFSCAFLEKRIPASEPLEARWPGRRKKRPLHLGLQGGLHPTLNTATSLALQLLAAGRQGAGRQHFIKEPLGWIQGQNRCDKWPVLEFSISSAEEKYGRSCLNSSLVTLNRARKEASCFKRLPMAGRRDPSLAC